MTHTTGDIQEKVSKIIFHDQKCPAYEGSDACYCQHDKSVQKIVALIEEEKDRVDWKKTNKLVNKAMKLWEQSTDKPTCSHGKKHVCEICSKDTFELLEKPLEEKCTCPDPFTICKHFKPANEVSHECKVRVPYCCACDNDVKVFEEKLAQVREEAVREFLNKSKLYIECHKCGTHVEWNIDRYPFYQIQHAIQATLREELNSVTNSPKKG